MSAVAEPMGAPYLMIFSPAAIALRESLCPIGTSAGIGVLDQDCLSPMDARSGNEDVVGRVEKKETLIRIAARLGRIHRSNRPPVTAPRAVPKNYRRSGVIRRDKNFIHCISQPALLALGNASASPRDDLPARPRTSTPQTQKSGRGRSCETTKFNREVDANVENP